MRSKALYGLHSSGARWAESFADTLCDLGWEQSKCDPAVWMKSYDDHYGYLCVWVDDIIVCDTDPMHTINGYRRNINLKESANRSIISELTLSGRNRMGARHFVGPAKPTLGNAWQLMKIYLVRYHGSMQHRWSQATIQRQT